MSRSGGESLQQALDRIARAPRLLLAFDFDGTLSPLVDRPERARMLPAAAAALRRLSTRPGVTVALVSGRPLASLRPAAAPPPRFVLVGSHGVEFAGPLPGAALAEPSADERARVAALIAALDAAVGDVPGVRVERKPFGAGVHWRRTPAALRAGVRPAALAVTAGRAGLTARDGKELIEFSVRAAHKGESLRLLRRALHADALLFAGDDVTDEDGFAVLGPADVGIKVGRGPTRARHRLASPAALAALLAGLDR